MDGSGFGGIAFGLAAAAFQHQQAWHPQGFGSSQMGFDIGRMENAIHASERAGRIEQARHRVHG